MSPDISLNLCNFCLTNSAHALDLVRHRNPLFLRNEGHVEICWIKAVACGIDTLNSQFFNVARWDAAEQIHFIYKVTTHHRACLRVPQKSMKHQTKRNPFQIIQFTSC